MTTVMYDPETSRGHKRLKTALEWSLRQLKPHRERFARLVKMYAPELEEAEDHWILNMHRQATDIYTRTFGSRDPSVLVLARDRSLALEAYEFEIAMNQLLKVIRYGSALRECVKNACLLFGVMKCGITAASEYDSQGFAFDAGTPFVESVLPEDWVHDMQARRPEEWGYCGDRYKLPLEDLLNDPNVSDEAKEYLERAPKAQVGSELDEKVSQLATDDGVRDPDDESFLETREVWDVYIPRLQMVTTLTDDFAIVCKSIHWDCDPTGPYDMLRFGHVPGNVVPSPQVGTQFPLADIINKLYRKVSKQANNQATVWAANGAAANDGTVDRLVKAEDNETVRVDDVNALKPFSRGGPDRSVMGLAELLKGLYSYSAGNLDTMGGLSPSAPTARQEQIMANASSAIALDMGDAVNTLNERVVKKLGYWIYTDPMLTLKLEKKVTEGIVLPVEWGPERRQAQYSSFNVTVQPYSSQSKTPADRSRQLLAILSQVIAPFAPMMQAQGIAINFVSLLSLFERYEDLPELSQILEVGGLALNQAMQAQETSRKPPVTSRENVRVSVAGGPTGQNKQNQLVNSLLSGADNGAASQAFGE